MDFLTKLEMIDGLSIVTDNNVAVEILKSDAFSVVNIVDHLKRLQENTGVSLENLIKFASYSPFFNEGDKHQELKKIFSDPGTPTGSSQQAGRQGSTQPAAGRQPAAGSQHQAAGSQHLGG